MGLFFFDKTADKSRGKKETVGDDAKDKNETNKINTVGNTGFTSPTEIVEIIKGDITELAVDVIVNSAHHTLMAGSGVCGAIHKAAGKELEKECKKIAGDHLPGQLALTQGYNLKARYVIHAIVPQAKEHGKLSAQEKEAIANCYKEAIYTANRCGMKSIAFPSLGTGVRGYPIREMSELAVKTVIDYLGEFDPAAFLRVCLAAHSEEDYIAYQNAYKNYLENIK